MYSAEMDQTMQFHHIEIKSNEIDLYLSCYSCSNLKLRQMPLCLLLATPHQSFHFVTRRFVPLRAAREFVTRRSSKSGSFVTRRSSKSTVASYEFAFDWIFSSFGHMIKHNYIYICDENIRNPCGGTYLTRHSPSAAIWPSAILCGR